jgi:hypothetical protein
MTYEMMMIINYDGGIENLKEISEPKISSRFRKIELRHGEI